MTTILDPTDERVPVRRSLTKRPEAISGTVALLDISKPRGDVLLNQLEVRLRERLPEVDVLCYSKPTFTKPAPESLKQELAKEADFVVEGLAD